MKTVLRYAWLALAAILVGCGGGDDLPVAAITASTPQPVRAASVVMGGTEVGLHVYQALYGQAPSHAQLSSFLTQIGSGDGFAWANSMALSFSNLSNTALSTLVLNNINITPTSLTSTATFGTSLQAYSALQGALADYFGWVGVSNRGIVITQLSELLSNSEIDTQFGVYGNAAAAFNRQSLANSTYSSNAANVVAAAVSLSTANAGSAQTVTVGQQVALDGTSSSSVGGAIVAYGWTLTTRPVGSATALSSLTSAKPTFTADAAGTYVVSLIVNDGTLNSNPANVSITAIANVAPVARAGVAQTVVTGSLVTLNGSGSSDANGDTLTYLWTGTRPAGSTAVFTGATSAAPTFTADVAGAYVISLVVNDGKVNSAPSTVTITATAPVSVVTLYLYSRDANPVYLGCLNCSSLHLESVCNQFGTYGSMFQSRSIWNQFGTYGSQFSSYSPWNQFSSNAPEIRGSNNLFYGYFTTNAFQYNRTIISTYVNVLNFYSNTSDLASTRVYMCGN